MLLDLNLENCYGITKLKQTIEFQEGKNTVLVYAPNGMMKTSLAKTFYDISKREKPKDEINPDATTIADIKIDSTVIDPKSILVVDIDQRLDSEKAVSNMLVNSGLKEQFEDLFNELTTHREDLEFAFDNLSNKHIKDFATIEKVINDSYSPKNINTYFVDLYSEIKGKDYDTFDFDFFDVFDEAGKTEKFIRENYDVLKSYFDTYNDLWTKSTFFSRNFDSYKAKSIAKSFEGDGFFEKGHKICVNENGTQKMISCTDEFIDYINNQIQIILNNDQLKDTYNTINQKINKNKELKKLAKILKDNPEVILRLNDFDGFKKYVLNSYLKPIESQLAEFSDFYKSKESEFKTIIETAKSQNGTWKKVIEIFKNRFHMPFEVSIKNSINVILGIQTPVLDFKYKNQSKDKEVIFKVLSKGEKRVFNLLNFIYEIEARKKENTFIVIDDIADSFDYKNKYAILEYIQDLTDNNKFHILALSHNYDFFRTMFSRLKGSISTDLMAHKNTSEEIIFSKCDYEENMFMFHICKDISNSPKKIISAIPFVRNIVEYNEGKSQNYLNLTSCLHLKNGITDSLTIKKIFSIFNKYISTLKSATADAKYENDNIKNFIMNTAKDMIKSPSTISESEIEDKFTLSIALRLRVEEFLMKQIKPHVSSTYFDEIDKNQTLVLMNKYKSLPIGDKSKKQKICSLVERVNMMTTQNIHVNAFMFEPLVDTSVNYLVELWEEADKLNIQ